MRIDLSKEEAGLIMQLLQRLTVNVLDANAMALAAAAKSISDKLTDKENESWHCK